MSDENRADNDDDDALADLYPGYESHWVPTSAGRIFARTGGDGPPLLLLHGYPQTNVIWHQVAPELANHFKLIIADLPGYGWSDAPRPEPDHAPYTKRTMAKAMIELMEQLGHARFHLAGHDRGGRVAYRLALDHPGRLERLAVLDIVPTGAMWHNMDAQMAMKVWHWPFLAQDYPLPEMFIGKAPVEYIEWKMASLAKSRDLSSFDPRAMAHYRAFISVPERIHATCEDYRAGWGADRAADDADQQAGNTIACPVLALWGSSGIPSESTGPLAIWKTWARDVRGVTIDCGHYPCEEAPEETAAALIAFFTAP